MASLLAACNGAASFSCTPCDIIMSCAASAYDPARKHRCQNPYFDIGDGAGMTSAFADHPFTHAVLQLRKAINSMASSFRAAKSPQFVYTPSSASSMRDPDSYWNSPR